MSGAAFPAPVPAAQAAARWLRRLAEDMRWRASAEAAAAGRAP